MAAFNITNVARVELVGDDPASLSDQALILFRAVRAAQGKAGAPLSEKATVCQGHMTIAFLTANQYDDITYQELKR